MPTIKRSTKPILNEFARKLKSIGKYSLYELLSGQEMEAVKIIADTVGFNEYPVAGERIDDYLNRLWPYVLAYKEPE